MENKLMIGKNVRLLRDIVTEGENPVTFSRHSLCRVQKDLSFYCITGKTQGIVMKTIDESAVDRKTGIIKEPKGEVNMQLERDIDYKLCL